MLDKERNISHKAIIFNTKGYDPFIDFIKAYAIICVLIAHTLPVGNLGYGLWAGMQVPLFILVQAFHFYKKDDSQVDFKKLCQRILLPFAMISFIEILLLNFNNCNIGCNELIISGLLNGGGYGPGAYFPLVYIQVSLLLPLFRIVFKRLNRIQLIAFFLVLAEGLEILCSVSQPPQWLYRLLAIRYIFLIYLGWLWVQDGIMLNPKMIVLSVLGALVIVYFEYLSVYFQINNEPWFFNTGWLFHRWPCYYFCANGLVYLLYVAWQWLQKSVWITNRVKDIAKSSYEIFLLQLLACQMIGILNMNPMMSIISIWVFSIVGGYYMNMIWMFFLQRKPQ